MSLVENFLLGEGSGSPVGEDPENMSVDSLESGENVIEFLLWGCFKKSVCFSTVGDGIGNLMGENIFLG